MKNSLFVLVLIPLIFSCNREFSVGSRRGFQGNTHIVEAKKKISENERSSPQKTIQSEPLQNSSSVFGVEPENEYASIAKLNQDAIPNEQGLYQNKKNEENSGCDEILLKTGESIKAIIQEIGEKEIKYKICPEVNSRPLYSVSKSKVFLINYSNGEREVFNDNNDKSEAENSQIQYKQNLSSNYSSPNPKVEGLGIASFILGFFGFNLFAIIFGFASLGRINNNPEKLNGRGFAITGIILGFLGIFLILLVFIL